MCSGRRRDARPRASLVSSRPAACKGFWWKWSLVRGISKVLWRVVLAAGVLFAAAIVAAWLLAPILVERGVARELSARGFPDAQFDVRYVGLRRAEIEGIQFDADGRLTVESLAATYSPLRLLRKEIESIEVIGARWVIGLHDRKLDLGPMDELFTSRGDGQEGAELPVRRIELVASDVIVKTQTQQWRVPIEGVLDRTADGFRVQVSAAPRSLPMKLVADVRQRPELQAQFALTATGRGDAALDLEGRLATDGRVHVQVSGHDWSTDTVVSGRRVTIDDVSVRGHATLARDPLELDALDLVLGTGEIRVDDRQVEELRVNAARVAKQVEVDVAWAAPGSEGVLSLRGFPTRLSPEHRQDVKVSCRVGITAFAGPSPVTIAAGAEARLVAADEQWTLQIDHGRLEVESDAIVIGRQPVRIEGLRGDVAFAGTVGPRQTAISVAPGSSLRASEIRLGPGDTAPQLEDLRLDLRGAGDSPLLRIGGEGHDAGAVRTALELNGDAGKISAARARGTVAHLGVQVQAERIDGQWDLRGRADVRLAKIVHSKAKLRIDQVSASLPLHYPFTSESPAREGRVRVGPVRWRGSKLPAVRGTLVQHGDEIVADLRWPLTADASVRGRGRVALGTPFEAELEIKAPPFEIEEAGPVAAILERALGGSITGRAAIAGQLAVRASAVTQTLNVRLDDVTLAESEKLLHEIHGVAGTIELDSIVPPLSPGGQRLRWKGGQVGKMTLGPGHVDFALEEERAVLVEEVATEVGARGEGGRLFIGAFRWARDQPKLHLDIFAETLSLQHWLDLLGRDEVTGSGTLHGHVSATLQLKPTLRVHLGKGVLLAEPGGTLKLQDVRAAQAALAIRDVKALPNVVKQRLIEALKNLRYSSLRVELIRRKGFVTLQVHVSGRGRRGARQEIGGLTININHVEDALNQLLRLHGGLERLRDASSNSQP